MMVGNTRSWVLILLLLFGLANAAYEELLLSDGNALPLEIFPAAGNSLVVWLPAETGLKQEDRQQAAQLAKLGHEVWLADLFSAYFLPLGQSSLDGLSNTAIVELIDKARQQNKDIYVLAPGRAAIPALRAINDYYRRDGNANIGLILLHPKLYETNPQPGKPARLMPVVNNSDVSVLILQPDQSPWRWRLHEIRPALEDGGSDVYSWILPGIRDRFWFRPDAEAGERAAAKRLPGYIDRAITLLAALPPKARSPGESKSGPRVEKKQEKRLQAYLGESLPPPLVLRDIQGHQHDLAEYKGQVVLVNFWASWCPPCVHEMPSMEGLYTSYKNKDFEILAVNMAEKPATINTFLNNKVRVSFNVLMDADGAALQRWKVFAFPTSYLIDRQGRIRYAVYGAIDWQSKDVIEKLEQLLQE